LNRSQKILIGLAVASFSAWASADALQVRGMAAGCTSCHGTLGVAQPGMDSLAGLAKDDFVKKMMDFKTGKKPATLMHQLSKGYSDAQIEQLAGYFAALKK